MSLVYGIELSFDNSSHKFTSRNLYKDRHIFTLMFQTDRMRQEEGNDNLENKKWERQGIRKREWKDVNVK